MGALAMTYKQQYKTPFSPMIGGARMVKWLDFEAVAEAVQKVFLHIFESNRSNQNQVHLILWPGLGIGRNRIGHLLYLIIRQLHLATSS